MKKEKSKNTLEKKFREIYDKHYQTLRLKSAKIVLGSSVIRALKKGIKEDLKNQLFRITIENLIAWSKSNEAFKKGFLNESRKIEKIIGDFKMVKKKKMKVNKCAHAPKILALYCRDLLGSSLACGRIGFRTYNKLEQLLFCPIDSIVIKELRKLEGGKEFFGRVKSMKDMKKNDFIKIQDWLMKAAKKTKAPCIWFDDVWV